MYSSYTYLVEKWIAARWQSFYRCFLCKNITACLQYHRCHILLQSGKTACYRSNLIKLSAIQILRIRCCYCHLFLNGYLDHKWSNFKSVHPKEPKYVFFLQAWKVVLKNVSSSLLCYALCFWWNCLSPLGSIFHFSDNLMLSSFKDNGHVSTQIRISLRKIHLMKLRLDICHLPLMALGDPVFVWNNFYSYLLSGELYKLIKIAICGDCS